MSGRSQLIAVPPDIRCCLMLPLSLVPTHHRHARFRHLVICTGPEPLLHMLIRYARCMPIFWYIMHFYITHLSQNLGIYIVEITIAVNISVNIQQEWKMICKCTCFLLSGWNDKLCNSTNITVAPACTECRRHKLHLLCNWFRLIQLSHGIGQPSMVAELSIFPVGGTRHERGHFKSEGLKWRKLNDFRKLLI